MRFRSKRAHAEAGGRFVQESPSNLSRTTGASPPGRPGTKFAEILCLPLGIARKRPYDGGLSFLAQMQIGVEDGV